MNGGDTIVITGNHTVGKFNSDVKCVSCNNQTNCNFTVFPTPIYNQFPNVVAFQLTEVGLTELSENSLGNCEKITNLQLHDNRIEKLEAGTFKNCINLKSLIILSNRISDVHKDAFINLVNLEDLNLYDNYILTIDPETFQHVPNLTSLFLSANMISSFHLDVFAPLTKLTIIDIGVNRLTILPSLLFRSNIHLKTLSFLGNRVNAIERNSFEDMNDMKNNGYLFCRSNICINENFSQIGLKGLTFDNVMKALEKCFQNYENMFTTLDPEVTNGTTEQITTTSIPTTSISTTLTNEEFTTSSVITTSQEGKTTTVETTTETPETTRQEDETTSETITSLKTSTATEDPNTTKVSTTITPVPTTESPFPKIDCRFYYDNDDVYTCELSNIQFRTINDTFRISGTHQLGRNHEDVEKVVFISSQLLKVPTVIFETFNNLTYLDINDVGLKAIHSKTFESCGQLRSINARTNNITHITEDSLQYCTELSHIDLSQNRIEKLHSRVFSSNSKLTTILINNNVITSIEPCNNVLQQLKYLKYLALKGNICVNNLFDDENLHTNFGRLALKDLNVCFSFWYMY
ncbi:unnamed protein product [Diamesa serratosioi]